MDQIERIITAITNGLNKVNTSIQKTQTYKDGNTYSLAVDTVVETAATSALLATLRGITLLFTGNVAGSSLLSGFVNHQLFNGFSVGSSSLSAILRGVTRLFAGDSAGISTVGGGSFTSIKELVGSCAGATTGAAAYMWT